MSETNHTPAPWAVETVKRGPDLYEGMLVKAPGRKSYVADTFLGMENGGDIPEAECRANARLIAAAPDLLAFATHVENGFGDGEAIHFEQVVEWINSAMQQARELVAKATHGE